MGGIPFGSPTIIFYIGDSYIYIPFENLKNWIDQIWKDKGTGTKEGHKAKKELDRLFAEIKITIEKEIENKNERLR